ncbi:uncharacterized protein Rv2082-like [Pogoniulus pusillus]|uniref:uncharacterized protein Rv2082-like n=1 Tax=Pogoniulus pusillus TaxID=488313 RepID=UPI0030B99110
MEQQQPQLQAMAAEAESESATVEAEDTVEAVVDDPVVKLMSVFEIDHIRKTMDALANDTMKQVTDNLIDMVIVLYKAFQDVEGIDKENLLVLAVGLIRAQDKVDELEYELKQASDEGDKLRREVDYLNKQRKCWRQIGQKARQQVEELKAENSRLSSKINRVNVPAVTDQRLRELEERLEGKFLQAFQELQLRMSPSQSPQPRVGQQGPEALSPQQSPARPAPVPLPRTSIRRTSQPVPPPLSPQITVLPSQPLPQAQPAPPPAAPIPSQPMPQLPPQPQTAQQPVPTSLLQPVWPVLMPSQPQVTAQPQLAMSFQPILPQQVPLQVPSQVLIPQAMLAPIPAQQPTPQTPSSPQPRSKVPLRSNRDSAPAQPHSEPSPAIASVSSDTEVEEITDSMRNASVNPVFKTETVKEHEDSAP